MLPSTSESRAGSLSTDVHLWAEPLCQGAPARGAGRALGHRGWGQDAAGSHQGTQIASLAGGKATGSPDRPAPCLPLELRVETASQAAFTPWVTGEVAEWAACPGAPGSHGLSTPAEEAQKPLVSLSLGGKEASHLEAIHVDTSPVPEEQARHPVRRKRDRCMETSSQPPGGTRDAPAGPALPRQWPRTEALFLRHLPDPERGPGKDEGK